MIRTVVASVLVLAAGLQEDAALQISHRARSVAPGEVVVLDVHAREPLQEVRADWLGQTVVFYPNEPTRWQGLVPIDLAVAPKRYALLLHARTIAGQTLTTTYELTVARRAFPVRRISVAPEFVDPPAGVLDRIAQERTSVEALLAVTTAERFWREPFVVPVPGPATSSFGRRTIANGEERSPHSGADFRAADGTPVVAPNHGRVVLATDLYFAGRTIVIDHGLGLYSYLAHLSKLLVADGAMVKRGERIALSGSTGRVTGPHLHWTMRVNGARVDPLSVVTLLKSSKPSVKPAKKRTNKKIMNADVLAAAPAPRD